MQKNDLCNDAGQKINYFPAIRYFLLVGSISVPALNVAAAENGVPILEIQLHCAAFLMRDKHYFFIKCSSSNLLISLALL